MRISDWSSDVCSSDLPYAAIPYIGDELNEKIASLRADPQIGVILFQRPYFANRDDACGPASARRKIATPGGWGGPPTSSPPLSATRRNDRNSVVKGKRGAVK